MALQQKSKKAHRKMGEKQLGPEILTVEDLIESRRFDSLSSIYNMPDSILPRVRRNGKIVRPLRFYRSDVDRVFSRPLEEARSLTIETEREPLKIARPSISFKKRRR